MAQVKTGGQPEDPDEQCSLVERSKKLAHASKTQNFAKVVGESNAVDDCADQAQPSELFTLVNCLNAIA